LNKWYTVDEWGRKDDEDWDELFGIDDMKVGDKIKFREEKQRYTVQAASKRFLVCTKPMNAHRTVLYTIVDFELGIRGREDLIFCAGFETMEQCEEALQRLESKETEVSSRNWIPLDIENEEGTRRDNEETSGEDGLMDEIEPRPLEDKVQGREAIALRNLTEH
jgi:hypothetical protein